MTITPTPLVQTALTITTAQICRQRDLCRGDFSLGFYTFQTAVKLTRLSIHCLDVDLINEVQRLFKCYLVPKQCIAHDKYNSVLISEGLRVTDYIINL